MEDLLERKIGEIVADNYQAADVFSKYGLDFCCGGNKSVRDACNEKALDENRIEQDLKVILASKQDEMINFKEWPLDLLIDYIEKKHHRYVEENIPVIRLYLHKVVEVHGHNHPELEEVANLFLVCSGNLAQHMKKEELMLFPFIKKMLKVKNDGESLGMPPFGSVKNPVAMMFQEHDDEGERLRQIAKLTNNYTPPEDACNTYRVTLAKLEEFENDLHKHIHLENNILFPRAIALEQELVQN